MIPTADRGGATRVPSADRRSLSQDHIPALSDSPSTSGIAATLLHVLYGLPT